MSANYVKRVEQRVKAARQEINLPEVDPAHPPAMHREILYQIYRETNVTRDNLLANRVAMDVVAGSLSHRTGTEYTVAQVETLLRDGTLPKLANDRAFVARNHVTDEGKKYVRTVQRMLPRKRKSRTVADTPGSA